MTGLDDSLRFARSGLRAALLLGLLVLPSGSASAQAFGTCLQNDGVAYAGGHSAAVAGTGIAWVFGGPLGGAILCGPPAQGGAEMLMGGSAASANFAAGTGLVIATSALSPPTTTQDSRAYIAFESAYLFRVVPDDPLSNAPVEIDVTTRHRFGADQVSATGDATASNSYRALYAIESAPIFEAGFVPDWQTTGLPIVPEGYYDLVETVTVPVNQDLVFRTWVQHQSYARGNGGLPSSSAAAALTSYSTFEFETQAPAAIEFAAEANLGLAAPQLDVVPEPSFVAGFVPGLAILAGLSRRRALATGLPRDRFRP